MSIESITDGSMNQDALSPTKKLLAAAGTRRTQVQRGQRGENKLVLQNVSSTSYNLSIVVPTRNERDNIMPLIEALYAALEGLAVEVIFVDDSDDETPEMIRYCVGLLHPLLFRIRLEHRPRGEARKGGLATAVVQGLKLAQAEYIAALDADLQHPPEQLRLLYTEAMKQQVDLVLASRYIKGGSYEGLDGPGRRFVSVGMKRLAKVLFPGQLLRISDPLGGFFLLRRSLVEGVTLRPVGYKILLEILIRTPWKQVVEVPYHFQARTHGQSKATMRQGTMALQHMMRLLYEVPAAGRIWKVSILLCLNALLTLILLTVGGLFSTGRNELTALAFALMACVDFVLFNRYIFPKAKTTREQEAVLPFSTGNAVADAAQTVREKRVEKYIETFKMPITPFPLSHDEQIEAQQYMREERRERWLSRAMLVVIGIATIIVGYTLSGISLILGALCIGTAVIFSQKLKREQAMTMLLAFITVIATIDYITWRFTVSNWSGWWISVPLLFAEVLGGIHSLGFQFTIWPWSPAKPEWGKDPTTLPIYIFIPTVNEGVSILRPTLMGALVAREKYLEQYPHGSVNIVVCNDGYVAKSPTWQETERLAGELGVSCITRTVGGGAKAGNIENARQQLRVPGDALLVIFDADQVARPNFLLKTIPPFRDTKMGWVQTGQYYANLDNPVSRWADDQQSMFYNLLCPGKASLNAAFICGTNVVLRSAALDQIGGLPQNSITEDFAASVKLHSSWRSIYLTDVLATGLGPLDMQSYLKQQSRWAMGTLGIFRTHWREILLPQRNGLRLEQRVQYFLACTHYLCGPRDLIYVVSPILFVLTGVPAVHNALLGDYLWHFVPYSLLSLISLWYASRGLTGLRGIIIGFGSFPVLVESLLSVILRRKVGFSVTAKQKSGKTSRRYLWTYVAFILLCLLGLFWATRAKGQEPTSLFISVMWIVYSLLMLGSFLWLNVKDIRFQAMEAKKSDDVVMQQPYQPYPSKLQKRKGGLSLVGNLGLGVLVATPLLASSFLGTLSVSAVGVAPRPFVLSHEKVVAPYIGLSLPAPLLETRQQVLEHDLNTRFAIIGRTQDIVNDHFDTAWAQQLASEGARPWITLQFGAFGPDNKPPLDASLPAIANGLHDGQIKEWAQAIRAYGKPVYLTILPQADRNWSLSSGVANGGIPEDVSRVWQHVRSVFTSVGATNVAWVWAPADPLNDQQFAPPTTMIDAVLQTFVNYPGTKWGDPDKVLLSLTKHYPTKPIIIDASVDGPPSQKAFWMMELGQAIDTIPQIYALLYHEGGPALNLSPSIVQAWSLASDPDSLAAMQRIITDARTQAVARSF